jgi:hypothetical protein
MANELCNLDLFSQEISFSLAEGCFVDLLHGNNISSFLVQALVDCGKLTISKLPAFVVLLFKAKIVALRSYIFDPMENIFYISVEKVLGLNSFVVMRERKSEHSIPYLLHWVAIETP